jgi:hypothetical protein
MFKVLLISVVLVPVLIGMLGGRARDGRRGLALVLGLFFTYDVLYLLMLYYLRVRWVG